METKYYMTLYERYLNAETTVQEEEELRVFLSTTDDVRFEEARESMGLLTISALCYGFEGKEVTQFKKSVPLYRWMLFAAATAAIILLAVLPVTFNTEDECFMATDGVRINEHSIVINEMNNQMTMLFMTDEANSLESEMTILSQ